MSKMFRGPLTGRHVLIMLLAFFGIVFAANGAFVYFARASWTGVETEDAYRKGLSYNRAVTDAEAQHALGWKIAAFEVSMDAGRQVMTVRLVDAGGAPLRGLDVAASLRRPTTDRLDRQVTLSEGEDGLYRAALDLPEPGQWDVEVVATRGHDRFRAVHRIIA